MTKEEKQKAMLADSLTVYIKDKHTQEECTGFIDGFNKVFERLEELESPPDDSDKEDCDKSHGGGCKHDGRKRPDPLGGIYCAECHTFVNKEDL